MTMTSDSDAEVRKRIAHRSPTLVNSTACCSINPHSTAGLRCSRPRVEIGDVGMQYAYLAITLIGVTALLFVSLVALASMG